MKAILLSILIISLVFTSGCWDKEEIEQRLYVTTIGVDLNEEATEGDLDRFNITYQYPNIDAIGKNAGGGPRSHLATTDSSSIFQAGREFMGEVPYPFFYKHLKVIILGEDLLKEGKLVRSILDELNRDTKINKRVRIVAAEGKAIDILKANYLEEQRTEGAIYATVRDNRHTASFTSKALTDLIIDSDIADVSIVPRIYLDENNKFSIEGGCIIKEYRFLDWVDRGENKSINLINGDLYNETIDVFHNDKLINFAVRNSSASKEVKFNDKIIVDLNIRLEGYLTGYYLSEETIAYSNKVLLDMEKTLEEELKKYINPTIAHLQEIKADVIGIGEHLSKFHPGYWEKVEKNWDEIFSDIKFNVNADVKIRRTGLTK